MVVQWVVLDFLLEVSILTWVFYKLICDRIGHFMMCHKTFFLFFFCQHLRRCARSLKRHLRKLRKQIAQARSVTILWLLQPKNFKESFSRLLSSEIVTTGLSVPLVMVVLFCWVFPKCRTAHYLWTQLLESPVRTQSISSMREGFCEAVVNKKGSQVKHRIIFPAIHLAKLKFSCCELRLLL